MMHSLSILPRHSILHLPVKYFQFRLEENYARWKCTYMYNEHRAGDMRDFINILEVNEKHQKGQYLYRGSAAHERIERQKENIPYICQTNMCVSQDT